VDVPMSDSIAVSPFYSHGSPFSARMPPPSPLSKWLGRPWPPEFFLPNCPCCAGGGTSQGYHVFGGATSSAIVASNYLWNSAWTTKTAMSPEREEHAAQTPSTSGAAFIYGGVNSINILTRLDTYTPDAWTADTAMPSPARSLHTGCVISGKAYSWAGLQLGNITTSQNDQCTPGSPSTWVTKTACLTLRSNGAASYIGSKGYFFGGDNSTITNQVKTNEEYDPAGDSWTTKASTPLGALARNGQASFSINSVAYMIDGGPTVLNENQSYTVDAWVAKSTPLTPARQYPAGNSLDASLVGWITGGGTNATNWIATHEEYTPDSWTNRTNLPVSITHARAAFA